MMIPLKTEEICTRHVAGWWKPWENINPFSILSTVSTISLGIKSSRRAHCDLWRTLVLWIPFPTEPWGWFPEVGKLLICRSFWSSGSHYVNEPFQGNKCHPNALQEVLQHREVCFILFCKPIIEEQMCSHARKCSSERKESSWKKPTSRTGD